eukprot:scaffold126_cov315-Pavlova_lutheri.AAC.35
MNTARKCSSSPSLRMQAGAGSLVSKLSTWAPKKLRITDTCRPPMRACPPCFVHSALSDSMMRPAQVPHTGFPAPANARSALAMPSRSASRAIVVLSPPGITSASQCSSWAASRTSTACTPSPLLLKEEACSAKDPCSASTPTTT